MDEQLSQAISLFNSGKKHEAQVLLTKILENDPSNSKAWYGMALCQKENDKVIYCLEKTVALDTTNEKAKQLLRKVQARSIEKPGSTELKKDEIGDIKQKKCMKCGALNLQTNTYCSKCGSILKRSLEHANFQDPGITNRNNDKKEDLPKALKILLVSGSVIVGILVLFVATFLLLKRYLPSFSSSVSSSKILITPTPENSYKSEMAMIAQDIRDWQIKTNDFGSTYGSDLGSLQTIFIIGNELGRGWLLEAIKKDQPFIDNVIQIETQLSVQGKRILNTMNLVTPPEEIAASHTVIVQCMQERIASMEEQIIGLENLIPMGSEHSFVGPECYSFDAAVEKILDYVNNP